MHRDKIERTGKSNFGDQLITVVIVFKDVKDPVAVYSLRTVSGMAAQAERFPSSLFCSEAGMVWHKRAIRMVSARNLAPTNTASCRPYIWVLWRKLARMATVLHTMGPSFAWATCNMKYSLIARFMGPTWSPSGADRSQVPHVGPMNFACWVYSDQPWCWL